jgi:hypothetical protein
MSGGSITGWSGRRPPGLKNLEDRSDYQGSVLNWLKRTGLHFLQIVYSQRAEGRLHYDPDEELTEIKIADQYSFQLEADDTRPAIIGVRGGLSWSNIGMNMGMQESNMRTEKKAMTGLIAGSVGFTCISRVGVEAEQIASDVFNLFKFFQPTLMKYGFFTVKSMSVGPEQLVESPAEPKLFAVSVMLQCQVQDRWLLKPKSAIELRKVVVKTLTEINGDEEVISETIIENTDDNEGGS